MAVGRDIVVALDVALAVAMANMQEMAIRLLAKIA
jgi:hypothetical protein